MSTVYLEAWLTKLLDERVDKRWTPKLYARQGTIEQLGAERLGDVPIEADEDVDARVIEVRGEAYDEEGNVTGEEVKATTTAVQAR